jgi:hypothetical protein
MRLHAEPFDRSWPGAKFISPICSCRIRKESK